MSSSHLAGILCNGITIAFYEPPLTRALHGVCCTSQPLASEAGLRILKAEATRPTRPSQRSRP